MTASTVAVKALHGLSKGFIAWYDETTKKYSVPEPLPGLIEVKWSPTGESQTRFADNGPYVVIVSDSGSTGELTLSGVSEAIENKMLGRKQAANGLNYSSSDEAPKTFALLFQEETDTAPIRHVHYMCTATTPERDLKTDEEDVQFSDLVYPITMATVPDGDETVAYANVSKGEGKKAYDEFFSKVILPSDLLTNPQG